MTGETADGAVAERQRVAEPEPGDVNIDPERAPDPVAQTEYRPSRWRRAVALSSYLAIAVALTNNLWRQLPQGRLTIGGVDQYLFEWFLWHGPHAVLSWQNPLFTTLWDPPNGANLMANTAALGLSLPMAPVTLVFGPQVSLVVLLTLGLAGSAAAWYWFFRRVVPSSTLAAAIGGGFCGFAPPMVSHANGAHLNLVITALIPFIIANALRLRERRRAWRNGPMLGLLVAYQIFIGEELVLLAALGLALFCLAYAAFRPRLALAALPHLVAGLAVAVAVVLPLVTYPLWWQFTGPQSYAGLQAASTTTNDIMSLVTLPSQSFIGDPASTQPFVQFHNEENAFFGVPLLMLVLFSVCWLRRELLARLSAVMIVAASVLSFGAVIRLDGRRLVAGPWTLLQRVPPFDSLIVSRLTLLAVPFIGLLLTLMTARIMAEAGGRASIEQLRVRRFALLGVAAALVSIAPSPLPVIARPTIPSFITSGEWRQSIDPGSTVMTVPMTMADGGLDTINWQVPSDGQFSLVGGYFVGPHGPNRIGQHFPANTPTQRMINNVWRTGKVPQIGHQQQVQAQRDLASLKVDVIVVAESGHVDEAVQALTALLGVQPARVSDVRLWEIRDGVAVESVS